MNRVALVGGVRTPFVKAGGAFAKRGFLDLGIHTVKSIVKRLELDAEKIDELIYGTVLLDPRLPNFAREIVLRSGLPQTVGAHSVSNNCISGLVAAEFLASAIRGGRAKVGLAGGSESMSRPTLTFHPKAEDLFLRLAKARSIGQRLQMLLQYRFKYIFPKPPSPREPSTGLTMGEHMEITAKALGIDRKIQDEIAFNSHQNAAKAAEFLKQEIEPLDGVEKDNLIRGDTTLDKLAKLPAVFDRSARGTLSAGNSSALTDGASVVCLMSEDEAKRQGREILAFVELIEFAAIPPNDGLLMAPCVALPKLLQRANLKVADIDLFEIHEAFAAQVAANMKIWQEGWKKPYALPAIGAIPMEKVNINGGSIAIGHPFAATGGRLLLSLANSLKRNKLKTGVISVCAAGAMAAAVLLRRE